MRVEEAVQLMTKSYLHRVIDSFTRDLPKVDEDRSREIILRNAEELTGASRVATALSLTGHFAEQILLRSIMEALVSAEDHRLNEETLIERVLEVESKVVEAADDPTSLRYQNEKNIAIFSAVLSVALEDNQITQDELRLVGRLSEKLGLNEHTKHIVMAQLGHFPKTGNDLHSRGDFKDALIDLQRRGVVFYCNKLEGGQYVVPEEIVGPVRDALGLELSESAWRQLLTRLSQSHLATILAAADIPKSGTKDDQVDRIVNAGMVPSHALDSLANSDLYDICKALPGAKVSGTKEEKVERLVDYFATLVTKQVAAEAPVGELYYQYLVELATRDRESLLANRVIKKDLDMERAFEEGTRFLVTEKLGLELLAMAGTEHADGGFRLPRSGEVLLWDNKSKEATYRFPEAHLKQFKRYIRDFPERVSCFLVIVPEIGGDADSNALRLKAQSGADTDVALITAENLRWVAEDWGRFAGGKPFDPEVFNHNGVLTRRVLEQRMKLFLG